MNFQLKIWAATEVGFSPNEYPYTWNNWKKQTSKNVSICIIFYSKSQNVGAERFNLFKCTALLP